MICRASIHTASALLQSGFVGERSSVLRCHRGRLLTGLSRESLSRRLVEDLSSEPSSIVSFPWRENQILMGILVAFFMGNFGGEFYPDSPLPGSAVEDGQRK